MKHTRNTFKKTAAFLLAVMLLVAMVPMVSVSAEGAIEISTVDGFKGMKGGNSYVLTKDLDFKNETMTSISLSDGDFTLDGNGHKLTGLNLSEPLFTLGSEKNYTFENIIIDTTSLTATNVNTTMGLVYGLVNKSVINAKNIYVNATVSYTLDSSCNGAFYAGVFGQVTTGTIENVVFDGSLTVDATALPSSKVASAGGIVGSTNTKVPTFINCVNNADITVTFKENGGYHKGVGGILGQCGTTATTFYSCVNTGNITVVNNDNDQKDIGLVRTVGSIVSVTSKSQLKLVDCANMGTVTQNSEDYSEFLTGNSITNHATNSATITNTLSQINEKTTAYMQYTKATDGKRDVRFILVLDKTELEKTEPATTYLLTVTFKKAGEVVATRSFTSVTTYETVNAAGKTYTAADGTVLCGCVITGVPDTAWDALELSFDASVDTMDFSGSVSK